ncbi:MAG: class I SAM-dependent methyltransferase [Pseudomonadota bacterium]
MAQSDKSHWQEGGSLYSSGRPTYPDELAAELAAIAPSRDHALDVACGTGQLTALLGKHMDKVTGTDISADQIANAKPADNITYYEAPAEESGLPDKSVSLITVAQAAHWLDLPIFYEEVRRIAKDNAVIALITYGVMETGGKAGDRILDFYWKDIHRFWPAGRAHVENAYRDRPFPFDPLDMKPLAIVRQWDREAFLNYLATWSAVKEAKKQGADDIIAAFVDDLGTLLPDGATVDISWPISVRLGRV